MIITLTDDGANGLCPEAVSVLNSEFKNKLYHSERRLRHPYGRYCVSIDNYVRAFSLVLDEYEKLKLGQTVFDGEGIWASSIVTHQQAFLNAIMEHFDAIDDVIRAFFPDENTKMASADCKNFFKAIKPYRTTVGTIINRVKHNGCSIRPIAFYGNGKIVPGYFIEGTIYPHGDTPCVGPDSAVHPDSNSAFSFARDIRLHIVHLYLVSKHLSNLIKTINRPISQGKYIKKCTWIIDIAKRINNIRDGYYFDEIRKPNPSIRVGEANRTTIQLTFRLGQPKPVPVTKIIGLPWHMRVHWLGDQVSDIYKMPYGGKEYGCPKIASLVSYPDEKIE